jgi:hypothetical protein
LLQSIVKQPQVLALSSIRVSRKAFSPGGLSRLVAHRPFRRLDLIATATEEILDFLPLLVRALFGRAVAVRHRILLFLAHVDLLVEGVSGPGVRLDHHLRAIFRLGLREEFRRLERGLIRLMPFPRPHFKRLDSVVVHNLESAVRLPLLHLCCRVFIDLLNQEVCVFVVFRLFLPLKRRSGFFRRKLELKVVNRHITLPFNIKRRNRLFSGARVPCVAYCQLRVSEVLFWCIVEMKLPFID